MREYYGDASTLEWIPSMIQFQHRWLLVSVPENLRGLSSSRKWSGVALLVMLSRFSPVVLPAAGPEPFRTETEPSESVSS